MFGHIQGIVDSHTERGVIIDVAGIGYVVACSKSSRESLVVGSVVKLVIHTHISDSAFDLYGFLSNTQMSLFRLLISVNGVGPKTALHIMDLGDYNEILQAIGREDAQYLTCVSGVGKRTVERIIVELKDKVGVLIEGTKEAVGDKLADVIDALVAMGYSQNQARDVVRNMNYADRAVEDLIREALSKVAG